MAGYNSHNYNALININDIITYIKIHQNYHTHELTLSAGRKLKHVKYIVQNMQYWLELCAERYVE